MNEIEEPSETDPGVLRLWTARSKGASEAELHKIEAELLRETDNGPRSDDQSHAKPPPGAHR